MIKIIVEKVGLIDNSVNDCYVRHEIIRCREQSDRQIVRLAKTIMGWTGVVCRREVMGDIIRLKQPNTTLAIDIDIQHM
jgi:hypothetical protein